MAKFKVYGLHEWSAAWWEAAKNASEWGHFPSGNQRWLGHPLPKKVYSWENHLQKCVLFNCHVCLLAGIPIKYEASGLDFGQFFFSGSHRLSKIKFSLACSWMSSTPRNDLFRVYSCCVDLVASNLLWMVVPMIKALVFTRKCYVTDIKWLYHMYIYIYIQQNELQSDHEDIFRISRVYPWSLIFILNCERPSLLSCYQYISWEHRDSSFVARSLRLPGECSSWRLDQEQKPW